MGTFAAHTVVREDMGKMFHIIETYDVMCLRSK